MKIKGVLQPEESNTFFDRILEIAAAISMAMIFFAMLALSAHVCMRYIFDKPLNWTIDVSSIFLLFITMLAGAWLQKSEGHVAIDLLFTYLRRKAQIKLHIFNSIVCVISFLILIVFGVKETITVYQLDLYEDMPLEPPKWLTMVVIPIGCLMLMTQFLRRTRTLIKKLNSDDEHDDQQAGSHPA